MLIDLRKKLVLTMLLAASLLAADEPLPSDINLCLDAWHASDKELAVCREDASKWQTIANKALSQRDGALSLAEKEQDPNFLGIPPLGWTLIGGVLGAGTTYFLTHH